MRKCVCERERERAYVCVCKKECVCVHGECSSVWGRTAFNVLNICGIKCLGVRVSEREKKCVWWV